MRYLKQDTAKSVVIGPFVDATDKITPETAVTLGAADTAAVYKDDASSASIAARTFTHLAGGIYKLDLTADETDIPGQLKVYVRDDSVCVPVSVDFTVLPANVYDSLIKGTDQLNVDVAKINDTGVATFLSGDALRADTVKFDGAAASGLLSDSTHLRADVTKLNGSATAASRQQSGADAIVIGAVDGTATPTIIPTNLTGTDDDHYNGRTIAFTSGLLAGQASTITDYDEASSTLTVVQLSRAPADDDKFVIV